MTNFTNIHKAMERLREQTGVLKKAHNDLCDIVYAVKQEFLLDAGCEFHETVDNLKNVLADIQKRAEENTLKKLKENL